MKLKIEELKTIPLRIVEELKAIKTMEENNKKRLMLYRQYENDIKEAYDDLERLIENWNEE